MLIAGNDAVAPSTALRETCTKNVRNEKLLDYMVILYKSRIFVQNL